MPEEINRVLTDHCSEFLFAPTQNAMINLSNEGLREKAYLTGDIMYDALEHYSAMAASKSTVLSELSLSPGEYLLVTLHRPYNVDDPQKLTAVLATLGRVPVPVVFPLHPRTRQRIERAGISVADNIKLIPPAGYLDFIWLERNAARIVTDSGGIQKEAYLQKVPCITVRPETEWTETVDAGWNILVGSDNDLLLQQINEFEPPEHQPAVFGNADSAEQMTRILEAWQR
jgi:UDP-N-acetylglucosamine 2-epimerase